MEGTTKRLVNDPTFWHQISRGGLEMIDRIQPAKKQGAARLQLSPYNPTIPASAMPDHFVAEHGRLDCKLTQDRSALEDRFEKAQDRVQPGSIMTLRNGIKLLAKSRYMTLDTITHKRVL